MAWSICRHLRWLLWENQRGEINGQNQKCGGWLRDSGIKQYIETVKESKVGASEWGQASGGSKRNRDRVKNTANDDRRISPTLVITCPFYWVVKNAKTTIGLPACAILLAAGYVRVYWQFYNKLPWDQPTVQQCINYVSEFSTLTETWHLLRFQFHPETVLQELFHHFSCMLQSPGLASWSVKPKMHVGLQSPTYTRANQQEEGKEVVSTSRLALEHIITVTVGAKTSPVPRPSVIISVGGEDGLVYTVRTCACIPQKVGNWHAP